MHFSDNDESSKSLNMLNSDRVAFETNNTHTQMLIVSSWQRQWSAWESDDDVDYKLVDRWRQRTIQYYIHNNICDEHHLVNALDAIDILIAIIHVDYTVRFHSKLFDSTHWCTSTSSRIIKWTSTRAYSYRFEIFATEFNGGSSMETIAIVVDAAKHHSSTT